MERPGTLRRFSGEIKSRVASRLWGGGGPPAGSGEPPCPASTANLAHYRKLRRELGADAREPVAGLPRLNVVQGLGDELPDMAEEGVADSASSPLASPRTKLRQTTFGATLDFVDALCEAGAALNAVPEDGRAATLAGGLEQLNADIQSAGAAGVNVCFPLSCENERVVRVPAAEARLLNSREKAPFMLCIEVLSNAPPSPPLPGPAAARGAGIPRSSLPGPRGGSQQVLGAVGAGYLPGGANFPSPPPPPPPPSSMSAKCGGFLLSCLPMLAFIDVIFRAKVYTRLRFLKIASACTV